MQIVVKALEFNRSLRAFTELLYGREALLYRRVYAHCRKSILDGAPLTGAPGQPIKTGRLYNSWRDEGSFEDSLVRFVTDLWYARIIEDNKRGATFRSGGGAHSVKLTRAGFRNIVSVELALVKRAVAAPSGRGSKWRDPRTGRFI